MNEDLGTSTELLGLVYSLKRQREWYEHQFYLSRRAYEGQHFVGWNRVSQQLVETPLAKKDINQLPEIAKQADNFENFLLSTDFTFSVAPSRLSDDAAVDESMGLSMLAENYYHKFIESTVAADWVHFALLDNTSFVEVSPNDHLTDVEYRQFEAFDILYDMRIKDWNRQRLVVKVVKKRKSDMANSKLYHFSGDVATNGDFFSWKDVYEAEKYGSFTQLMNDEVLIFEINRLIWDEQLKKDKLNIIALDGSGKVLRNDTYPAVNRMPIIPFRIFSGNWYQPSFVYRLIPLVKSGDMILNRVENILLKLAKGGWLKQSDEELTGGMNEETGQIINYDTVKPEPITMPTIPAFLPQWFDSLLGLSERYSISSILAGNLPIKSSGIRAGTMLDQIIGQTVRSNAAPINNLKSATKAILEITFSYLYEMWKTPNDVIYSDVANALPKFVSKKYKDAYYNNDPSVIGIPKDLARFNVEIDSGMGYTLEERKKTALALFKMGIIKMETVRKLFKLGSSRYILEGDEKPMYDTAEFKALVDKFPQMDEVQKTAFLNTLKTMGSMGIGNNGKPSDMISKLQMQQNGGGSPSGNGPVVPPVSPVPNTPAPTA